MGDWEHKAHVEADIYEKKPDDDNSWVIILVIVAVAAAIAAIYYITWPWWYPLIESCRTMDIIDNKIGTFKAVIIFFTSVILSLLGSFLVCSFLEGLGFSKSLFWIIYSLSFCWCIYGIILLTCDIFSLL